MNKFKVGDKVDVSFIPYIEFTIKEIMKYKNPHDTSDKLIYYNIVVEDETRQKKFRVTPLEIELSKSHIREEKLKELGI